MKMNRWWMAAGFALSLCACDDGGDDSGGGGAGGEGGAGGVVGGAGGAGAEGGEGGMTGGEGGMTGGAAGGSEPSIDDRCPDAQIRTHMLVLFPDRVDAYFFDPGTGTASYFCKFLDLEGNGITTATGMAQDVAGDFYVVASGEQFGRVVKFSTNGEWIEEVDRNVNLAGVDGIWNTFGEDYVVWSAGNQNFYRLTDAGRFAGTWTPPAGSSARVTNVTDLAFVNEERVVATFSDREAQLFAPPFAPTFSEEEVGEALGAANAVVTVETDAGTQLLMTSTLADLAVPGVMLFDPVVSGRTAPSLQRTLVTPGLIGDGIDVLVTESGFLVMNGPQGGMPESNIMVFNREGEMLNEIAIEGEGAPRQFEILRVFRDF